MNLHKKEGNEENNCRYYNASPYTDNTPVKKQSLCNTHHVKIPFSILQQPDSVKEVTRKMHVITY